MKLDHSQLMAASYKYEPISTAPRVESNFFGVNKLHMLHFKVRKTFLSDRDDVIDLTLIRLLGRKL